MSQATLLVMSLIVMGGAVAPLYAQPPPSTERHELPRYGRLGEFDGRYPVRVLTLETARLLDRGDGTVGLGDTRAAVVDRRVEIVTNTISDAVGIANAAVKIGVRDPEPASPGFAVGIKYYQSYPGLLNKGVRRIAESFSTITNADVDVSGWVGYATATWISGDGVTGYHLGLQALHPTETRFAVEDSVKGGGGSVIFEEGDDVSVMWGVDHRVLGTWLVALAEGGWSFGLERARFGVGIDAGSQRWRLVAGMTWPGVETDLATEPRDFFVNPVFSFHYRF